jgi:DNA-binding MarR family transcriptional regulator
MDRLKDHTLATDLGTVIIRLVKKLRKESATGQQLSLTERSTLSLLHQHKQMLPSELASMEKITNQSMSQVLSNLLKLGYIVRTASETDKRKVIISLTTAGEEMILQRKSERDQWLTRAIRETCNEEEVALMRQLIGPLTKLVDFE